VIGLEVLEHEGIFRHDSSFSLRNIPFGTGFTSENPKVRCFTRIGDFVIDLEVLEHEGIFRDISESHFFCSATLNKFMSENHNVWHAYRVRI